MGAVSDVFLHRILGYMSSSCERALWLLGTRFCSCEYFQYGCGWFQQSRHWWPLQCEWDSIQVGGTKAIPHFAVVKSAASMTRARCPRSVSLRGNEDAFSMFTFVMKILNGGESGLGGCRGELRETLLRLQELGRNVCS